MWRTVKPTSFARLSRPAACAVLSVTGLAIAFFVAISLSPSASGFADKPSRGAGDVELYNAEIQRIGQGEGYYAAASEELHARGYPTRSVFNWRTPLPMWLIGNLPNELLGRIVIGALAALLLALSIHVMAKEAGLRGAALCGLLLVGALMPCWLPRIYVMPVVWAGVLIVLSWCCFAIEKPRWGVGLGIAALFVRELALPYCVVGVGLAVFNRRWREAWLWLAGFLAYGVFYAWHVFEVLSLVGPNDRAHAEGWLQFGGAAFVISLAQMNAFLLLLPQWVTAIFLPLAMLGFASWNTAAGRRAGFTACAFVILFAFVGQPFNQYWGSLFAPLLCLGAAQAPAALGDLVRGVRCGKPRSFDAAIAS
jgi:hypothetical protein